MRTVAQSDPLIVAANIAGPLAWSAHLLATYAVVSVDCESPWHLPAASYLVITAMTAAIAIGGMAVGAMTLAHAGIDARARRRRWMGATATIASITFLVAVGFGAMPAVLLEGCH